MSDIDRIVQAYSFTTKDKQRLTDLLAQSYLLAKVQAYEQAQTSVGHIVKIRHPWQVGPTDVKKALQWASKQAEGITDTYETLLRHMLEEMPQERALGDIIGGIKQVISNVGDWIAGFLQWKTDQIANSTWGSGDSDGTAEWIDDAQDADGIDGSTSTVYVKIVPDTSSSDFCKDYAGNTYTLDEYLNMDFTFPVHPNCVHSAEIISADERSVATPTLKRAAKPTYLFIDINGVLSIPNAGLPDAMIDGKEAWPIPQANELLQTIDRDKRIDGIVPIWMTHWGKQANGWNDRAGIEHWRPYFPLSFAREASAKVLYPNLDKKALAIQYCIYVSGIQQAIWLQDGFSPEEQEWVEQNSVRLVDVNAEPLHSLLLSDEASAVQRIIDLVMIGPAVLASSK